FEPQNILGQGGYGQVDKVLSTVSPKEYARKRVLEKTAFRGRKVEDVKKFIAEIEILKRVMHHHIVGFVGSYTDSKCIALIMTPIAEMDLVAYLTNAPSCVELRTLFRCLTCALEFLHQQKIRDKHIKPGNILVDHGTVLFTDFGLARDFTDVDSTSISMHNGLTPRYCAPEVAAYESRNTSSNIWSLGIVFMEMIAVLKGWTVKNMDDFLLEHGIHEKFIRTNMDGLRDLITELEKQGNSIDNRALRWTEEMLSLT
ncbi:kinase-like domain-containing protein, partial [Clohesyomyces aquaticus]